MPTVSIVMPCFNHSRFIRESASSVLRQTHQSLELIVVDDASSDSSWNEIVRLTAEDSRVRAIRHERNRGAAKSRNDGIVMSRGEFIAFCDADDQWAPDKLTRQLELLTENPDRDLTFCDADIIDGEGRRTGRRFSEMFPAPVRPSGWMFADLVKANFINTQSVLMRRACVSRVGMFDEGLKGASVEDWWYWIRLSRVHRFIYSPERLGLYRMHSNSTHRLWRNYSISRYKVFRRMLRDYPDLTPAVKSRALLSMGIDLCDLGRVRTGRRLLWRAVGSSISTPTAYPTGARAVRQLLVRAVRHAQ